MLPAYIENFLPRSVTSRPLQGEHPAIDLVVGYNRANTSPILELLLARFDELIARVEKTPRQLRTVEPPHEGSFPGSI